ncbi:MAG: formate dehydrogenase accessory sulfurtransferase FdhD [Armatimonadetes bacterium]|nr:formate dehydrogenase accessory sulfurtransferase FdhD [Armatimonadota bacterium]MDE2205188.1 formate dehydrogenase accessory sulfurtransferase FdhD [Armatimonadota bacterium]
MKTVDGSTPVHRYCGSASARCEFDTVPVEAPIEICAGIVSAGRRTHLPLGITLRTPGADVDLVTGWLFAEGVVDRMADIMSLECGGDDHGDRVVAELSPGASARAAGRSRSSTSTAACGACSHGSLVTLAETPAPPVPNSVTFGPAELCAVPHQVRSRQPHFARTGGVHAAALFQPDGTVLAVGEDIGRHNALDKVIGSHLRAGKAFDGLGVFLSGRSGYELIQKAARAQLELVASVGAPSSLAIQLANRCGVTLVGFLRGDEFNVYTHADRIQANSPAEVRDEA